MSRTLAAPPAPAVEPDPREPVTRLLRDLGSHPDDLSDRNAARRLERVGPNELPHRGGRSWPRALLRQFTHPLALLLILAAGLAVVADTVQLAWAVAAVVVLNALFALVQESQAGKAGKAVEALGRCIAFEVVLAAALTTVPPLQELFGTTLPPAWALLALLPMPLIVWGVDEAYRALRRRVPRPTTRKAHP